MANQVSTSSIIKGKKNYDLASRTAKFAEEIIMFANQFKREALLMPLLTQFIRSGTSIGANYCEANEAESRKDFIHKIGICKKESRETQYWLQMIAKAVPETKTQCRSLWKEAHELTLIFSASIVSAKRNGH